MTTGVFCGLTFCHVHLDVLEQLVSVEVVGQLLDTNPWRSQTWMRGLGSGIFSRMRKLLHLLRVVRVGSRGRPSPPVELLHLCRRLDVLEVHFGVFGRVEDGAAKKSRGRRTP